MTNHHWQKMTLLEYQKYNNSCKQLLVFHFGTGAGFFSEYNNMIRMMVYCMIHKIKFTIYSSDCSFKKENGWSDFFQPFTDEIHNDVHHRINKRWVEAYDRNYYKLIRSVYHAIRFHDVSYMYMNNMPITIRALILNICRRKYKFNYVTSDLWFQTWNMKWDENINIPTIFSGTVRELFVNIDKLLWHYSTSAIAYVNQLKTSFALAGKSYYGMQIRGGDKFLETPLLSYNLYMKYASEAVQSNTMNILILTDDFNILQQLKKNYPTYNIVSYCEESEHGYFNDEFKSLLPKVKFEKTIRLLVQVELLRKSELFIGTYNAGPGEYLSIVMPNSKFISIN